MSLKCVKLAIFLGLTITTLIVSYQGPIKNLLDVGTTFQTSYIDINEIEKLKWPDVAICPIPIFKDRQKFMDLQQKFSEKGFKSMEEFQNEAKEVYYSGFDEIVVDVLMGDTYVNTMANSIDLSIMTVEVIDYSRTGFCHIISLEKGTIYKPREQK